MLSESEVRMIHEIEMWPIYLILALIIGWIVAKISQKKCR
jgi:hypothetical protein